MKIETLIQRDVVTIRTDASILEAARLMRAEHVGDLVVTGHGQKPVGILTDRDIVVSVVAKDVEHLGVLAVRDVLSADPVLARADEDADDVVKRMRRAKVRRVPVVDGHGALVGILCLDDLLAHYADELRAIASIGIEQRRREEVRRP